MHKIGAKRQRKTNTELPIWWGINGSAFWKEDIKYDHMFVYIYEFKTIPSHCEILCHEFCCEGP